MISTSRATLKTGNALPTRVFGRAKKLCCPKLGAKMQARAETTKAHLYQRLKDKMEHTLNQLSRDLC
jgi:hypothetical protein